MVYASTHRVSWSLPAVAARFAVTTAACGLAAVVWATSIADGAGSRAPGPAPARVGLATVALAVVVARELRGRIAFFHAVP